MGDTKSGCRGGREHAGRPERQDQIDAPQEGPAQEHLEDQELGGVSGGLYNPMHYQPMDIDPSGTQ